MAPLAQALQVSFHSNCNDGSSTYRCELDRGWAVGAIPQGGYSLGTVVEACIKHQAGSSHADPIHVTAHYLRATNAGDAEVRVKVLKSGKSFTNILADLVQQGHTKITTHLIFGNLSVSEPGQVGNVLAPPSPYSRRLPLHPHPSQVSYDAIRPSRMGRMDLLTSSDVALLRRNDPDNPVRTTSKTVGGGGIEWGAWFELTHKNDEIITSSIPFFCDSLFNLPSLLPEGEAGSTAGKRSWYPTITMTVEFKAKIPSSDDHSDRTGRGLDGASRIAQGDVVEGWREKQYCIAVADQMALTLPIERLFPTFNISVADHDSLAKSSPILEYLC
ncbi:thioesterase-like superfamily-domain-containing protein [Melanogaster broomeanus]|nr:thioesterase-like superfamily-domain-containing protein [Melanogaster broomeanus]